MVRLSLNPLSIDIFELVIRFEWLVFLPLELIPDNRSFLGINQLNTRKIHPPA